MPGKSSTHVRVSHVCSRSTACSRQVRARAHVEDGDGDVYSCKRMRSRPDGRGPAGGECACPGGGALPIANAASTAQEYRGEHTHAKVVRLPGRRLAGPRWQIGAPSAGETPGFGGIPIRPGWPLRGVHTRAWDETTSRRGCGGPPRGELGGFEPSAEPARCGSTSIGAGGAGAGGEGSVAMGPAVGSRGRGHCCSMPGVLAAQVRRGWVRGVLHTQ